MSKTIDLIGQRFGRLTVVSKAESKCGRTTWHCKCDCGNKRDILAINLTRGFTKSCGCLHNEQLGERRLIDLSGQKFGRLLVLERAENHGRQTARPYAEGEQGVLERRTHKESTGYETHAD